MYVHECPYLIRDYVRLFRHQSLQKLHFALFLSQAEQNLHCIAAYKL